MKLNSLISVICCLLFTQTFYGAAAAPAAITARDAAVLAYFNRNLAQNMTLFDTGRDGGLYHDGYILRLKIIDYIQNQSATALTSNATFKTVALQELSQSIGASLAILWIIAKYNTERAQIFTAAHPSTPIPHAALYYDLNFFHRAQRLLVSWIPGAPLTAAEQTDVDCFIELILLFKMNQGIFPAETKPHALEERNLLSWLESRHPLAQLVDWHLVTNLREESDTSQAQLLPIFTNEIRPYRLIIFSALVYDQQRGGYLRDVGQTFGIYLSLLDNLIYLYDSNWPYQNQETFDNTPDGIRRLIATILVGLRMPISFNFKRIRLKSYECADQRVPLSLRMNP